MDNFATDKGTFTRIANRADSLRPISLKFDRWGTTGPGMRDMHYEVELGIVCRGKMRREFKDGTIELSRDMIWTHGIWQPHSAFVVAAPLELLVIHIDPSMLSGLSFTEGPQINWLELFTAAASQRPGADIVPASEIRKFIGELKSLNRNDRFFNIRLRLIVLQLLLCILEHWNPPKQSQAMADSEMTRLKRVLELVFASGNFISVDEAAELTGMSRNGFNRFFEKNMGLRFTTFALHHRLSMAAAQLSSGDKPIKAIATACGFTDPSHFYRRFAEVYHCTPATYRQRHNSR